MAVKHKKPRFQSPGHYTAKDRVQIPAADFGDPDYRKFPIVTAQDVQDAARLIGHAADPSAVKRRIITISQRKGFPIPDAWAHNEESARVTTTTTTRAGEAALVAMPLSITRIDEANRLVTLRATSEAKDSFRTAFAYEASKDAFQRWERVGNIREMHAPKAVGRAVQVAYNDADRAIDVTLRVSKGAEDTWEKIKDGTLTGGSIGASNVVWETPNQRAADGPEKIAKKYDLVELSLVDNPSNPDCRVLAFRGAAINGAVFVDEETPVPVPAPVAPPQPPKGLMTGAGSAPVNPAIANAMADAYGEASVTRADAPTSAPWQMDATGIMQTPPAAVSPAAPVIPAQGLPAPDPLDITTARAVSQANAARRAERGRIIADAGDAAVAAANVPLPQVGQNYDAYAAQVAAIRGRAEAEMVARLNAAEAARADQTHALSFVPPETLAPIPADLVAGLEDHATPSRPLPADTPALDGAGLHEHAHTHADGTTHSHPHAHHAEHAHDHRADGAGHTEHEHMRLRGVLVDRAIWEAETVRGVPFQGLQAVAMQEGMLHANAPQKAQTAMGQITPQVVGQPVMYNTQDALALGFAVPAANTSVAPTPTESLILDPAQFHQGGHRPRFDNLERAPGIADQDGDYDGDEDMAEAHGAVKTPSVPVPTFTPVAYNDAEPTPMRLSAADETRIGMRNSTADTDSMHDGWRDAGLSNAAAACAHCGCAACQAMRPVLLMLLNGQTPEMGDDGDNDGDEDDDDAMEPDDDADRLQLAETQRQTVAALGDLLGVIESLAERVERHATPDAALVERLSDIQLQLADQQAGQASATRLQDAAVTRALAPILQQMHDLASVVGGVQATVERIANQPNGATGPVAPYYAQPAEKRLNSGPAAYSPYTAAPADLLDEVKREASKLPVNQQMDVATRIFEKMRGQ